MLGDHENISDIILQRLFAQLFYVHTYSGEYKLDNKNNLYIYTFVKEIFSNTTEVNLLKTTYPFFVILNPVFERKASCGLQHLAVTY